MNYHYESEDNQTSKNRKEEEQFQEETYEDFSKIAKHANFRVKGHESRAIQSQLVNVMEKLAKQMNSTFDDVFQKLCEKISDEKKREDFIKYINDWFEYDEEQKNKKKNRNTSESELD